MDYRRTLLDPTAEVKSKRLSVRNQRLQVAQLTSAGTSLTMLIVQFVVVGVMDKEFEDTLIPRPGWVTTYEHVSIIIMLLLQVTVVALAVVRCRNTRVKRRLGKKYVHYVLKDSELQELAELLDEKCDEALAIAGLTWPETLSIYTNRGLGYSQLQLAQQGVDQTGESFIDTLAAVEAVHSQALGRHEARRLSSQ